MRELQKSEWQPFFDRMSSAIVGKWAEIDVSGLDLGDQVAAESVPMLGITYDSVDDSVDVMLDRANHVIRHPEQIAVAQSAAGIDSVAVVDREGKRHVVRLKTPLALPYP